MSSNVNTAIEDYYDVSPHTKYQSVVGQDLDR